MHAFLKTTIPTQTTIFFINLNLIYVTNETISFDNFKFWHMLCVYVWDIISDHLGDGFDGFENF